MTVDGLRQDEIWVATGTVAVFSGTTTFGNQIVGNAGISGTTLRGSNVVFTGSVQVQTYGVPSIVTGSPAAMTNTLIQVGQSGTDAGSEQWVAFHRKFGAATVRIVATTEDDTAAFITAGSISAGSYLATSHGAASATFDWIAVGTR